MLLWAGAGDNTPSVGGYIFAAKITQATTTAPAAPAKTPAATIPSASKAKTTISCVKGKTTKKVTGINPKCPAGYKKK